MRLVTHTRKTQKDANGELLSKFCTGNGFHQVTVNFKTSTLRFQYFRLLNHCIPLKIRETKHRKRTEINRDCNNLFQDLKCSYCIVYSCSVSSKAAYHLAGAPPLCCGNTTVLGIAWHVCYSSKPGSENFMPIEKQGNSQHLVMELKLALIFGLQLQTSYTKLNEW